MVLLLLLFMLIFSCNRDSDIYTEESLYGLTIPSGFPHPVIPEDNSLNVLRVELGRKLFYDPILSKDSSISCASCHLSALAFTDGKALSDGVGGKKSERNAPTLVNIAYHNSFFWDGGNHSLEIQVVGPLQNELEMNLSAKEAVERLKKSDDYSRLMKNAYGLNEPNIFGLTRAIAAFERTLISGNSPYDKYNYQGELDALTPDEQAGMNLFFSSELKCSECHTGFNFTEYAFENNGIYLNYTDSGRARVTLNPLDAGKFKVPTLRNIELSGPYMHDGSFSTLSEVIDHYAQGGKGHHNQSDKVVGFSITADEKANLIAFLKSLTDHEFLNNPNFKNPKQ